MSSMLLIYFIFMVYLNSDVKFSEDVLNLIKFTIEKVDLHAQIVSDILKI